MRVLVLLLLPACAPGMAGELPGELTGEGLQPVQPAQPTEPAAVEATVTPSHTERTGVGEPSAMPVVPPIMPGQQPILIAQGMMGRTVLSCDDGQSSAPKPSGARSRF